MREGVGLEPRLLGECDHFFWFGAGVEFGDEGGHGPVGTGVHVQEHSERARREGWGNTRRSL